MLKEIELQHTAQHRPSERSDTDLAEVTSEDAGLVTGGMLLCVARTWVRRQVRCVHCRVDWRHSERRG